MNWMHNKKKACRNAAKEKSIIDKYHEYRQRLAQAPSLAEKDTAPPSIGTKRNYNQFSQSSESKEDELEERLGLVNEAFDQSVEDQWAGIYSTLDSKAINFELNNVLNLL